MTIILTPSAEQLDIEGVTLQPHPHEGSRQFPDGEVYVQLPTIDDDRVTVVHAGMPDVNTGLMYLYGILKRLEEQRIETDVFFTYFPYSMQDDLFREGTLNRARSLCRKLIEYYGVNTIAALDPHFAHRDWVEEMPFRAINTFPRIHDVVGMEDYLVIGPDMGAVRRFGIEGFEKKRNGSYSVDIRGEHDVEGRDVLVFDDIIETGTTMVETYERLDELGARRIEAAAVHGVMEEGVRRVDSTYERLYLTDSIANDRANVAISPLVRSVIRND